MPLPALLTLRPSRLQKRSEPVAVESDLLISDDGSLRTPVGSYRDCSGVSPIPFTAALWTCVPGRLYFVGHNPGVFTPLLHMRVGDGLLYIDHSGSPHRYRIVRIEDWGRAAGLPPPSSADVVAQLQTCVTADAWSDRIFDVIEST
jgi:hypothetical protein